MFISSKLFQEKLVYILTTIDDKDFQLQLIQLLFPEYFELAYLVEIIKICQKYYKRFYDVPSLDHILTTLDEEYPDLKDDGETNDENIKTKEEIRNFVTIFSKKKISPTELTDIKEKALAFAQKQKFKQVILDAADHVQKSSFDYIQARERFIRELIDIDDDSTDLDLKTDFDRYINIPRFPITTGLSDLDVALDGGIGAGEICMIIGGSGAGKTHVLVGRVAEAQKIFIKDNDCAVYFTCEIADHAIATRTASYYSKIPFNTLKKDKNCQEKTKEIIAQFKGTIKIKEYPSGTATIGMFRNYLERLRIKGYNIKMIVIDYPEEMAIDTNQTRLSIAKIYRQLRALGHKKNFNCPIVTCSQCNREMFESDIITLKGLAEAFAKGMICDIALSLSDEKLVLLKNRAAGKDHIVFPIKLDTDISYLEITGKSIPLKEYLKANKDFDQKEFEKVLKKRFLELQGDINGNGEAN